MRYDILQDLYDDDGQLKTEELRRLTPGTQEFALLDATLRLARRASPQSPLFQSLNPAYLADARIEDGEVPDQQLSAFGSGPLQTLRSFLALPPRSQQFIWEDDGRVEALVCHYLSARDNALADPASLPANWETAAPTPDNWEFRLQRSLEGAGTARPSLWNVTRPERPDEMRASEPMPRYRL